MGYNAISLHNSLTLLTPEGVAASVDARPAPPRRSLPSLQRGQLRMHRSFGGFTYEWTKHGGQTTFVFVIFHAIIHSDTNATPVTFIIVMFYAII